MLQKDRWLLPEGIEEVLPEEAARLETVRRKLLDLYHSWGYELVIPPLVEYLESLLTGTGNDLDLQTFKLTDQLTGRLMGVRADMTPQVARIDNHQLKREVPTRLCYLGTVLHTRPEGLGGSRSPLQVGAELYGHTGLESDLEVLSLMVETLRAVGLENLYVDLGHVGIFRGLAAQAKLGPELEAQLFDALQRKAVPEIDELLDSADLEPGVRNMLAALANFNGGPEALERAERELGGAADDVHRALAQLRQLAESARRLLPDVTFNFDLAELRGYHYHTGAVFAALVPGQGRAVALGGRYDDIGEVFSRPRPATGFSTDLNALIKLVPVESAPFGGIFAPALGDEPLESAVAQLRAAGERVVRALPGQSGAAADMGCDRELVLRDGTWEVRPLGA